MPSSGRPCSMFSPPACRTNQALRPARAFGLPAPRSASYAFLRAKLVGNGKMVELRGERRASRISRVREAAASRAFG